ncbi:hypothetical protein LXA43DRAFT_1021645 [Ganoderma leucocontextum]|nr:hypothetical protein LXA43DRAFT_1021645 [Ganoderma leucocontextum]
MHAALCNVARRRLVHGAAIQRAAASTSATPVPPASTVHDAPNVLHDASRSRSVVRDSHKDMEMAFREAPIVPHIRTLHTSSAARREDVADPNSFEARRHALPTSSWSRPPRPSQDADDNIVPTYYVERKKQRNAISQRKEEEGGLMNDLNASILGDGLAAETKAREEKMPVEVRFPDGTVAHPSGFEPPTAETEFHPVAAKVDTEEHPLLATVKQPWGERESADSEGGAEPIVADKVEEVEWIKRMVSEGNGGNGVVSGVGSIGAEHPLTLSLAGTSDGAATRAADRSKITTSAWDAPSRSFANDPDSVVPAFYVERKRQRDSIEEREAEERDLMHELGAGLRGDEVTAQMRDREEKIPVEVMLDDGTVAHPSGFVPPTAETDFHPIAAKSGDVPKQPWIEVLGAGVEGQNGSA